jgi:hypothetical protein
MAIILPYSKLIINKKKQQESNVYENINLSYFNDEFNFEEIILLENINKISDSEEFAWFIFMMSICFTFVFGIIKLIPEWNK